MFSVVCSHVLGNEDNCFICVNFILINQVSFGRTGHHQRFKQSYRQRLELSTKCGRVSDFNQRIQKRD